MFDRVLIANRGEIAVRIIRTLRRLGIASVAVYTDADRAAMHVEQADTAVYLEGRDGYLDIAALVAAARRSAAAAVHPGYGFLAENPRFARSCADAGVVLIGPSADAMELMGDKINAKRAVARNGVPVVPGRDESGLDDQALIAAAQEIGLPILIKPSAGGGGKGMRLVGHLSDLATELAAARREAQGAFGDDTLLVERYVQDPRHIEIQVLADSHGNTLSLGERECSLQRRHQKIVEEAPSPLIDGPTRQAMSRSAVAVARACGYVGAGTVEFIVSQDQPDQYFFMEMNTRLQVEHPVTEMVLGIDMVEWQLRIAAGETLPWSAATAPEPQGHAVEARVYAEDPALGFLPSSGTVVCLRQPPPRAGRLRIDTALQEGTVVGTDFDPLLAKVVAWGDTRTEALEALATALRRTAILGLTTNLGFLARLVSHPEVMAGHTDTGLVERISDQLSPGPVPNLAVVAAAVLEADPALGAPGGSHPDPWAAADGWRLSGPAAVPTTWSAEGGRLIEARRRADAVTVDGDEPVMVTGRPGPGGTLALEADGVITNWAWARLDDDFWLSLHGDTWKLSLQRETIERTGTSASLDGQVNSPMPGTVLAVYVSEGDEVAAGQPMMSVEAMKMEHVVRAPHPGRVTRLLVRPGDAVALDQPLVTVDTNESGQPIGGDRP